MRYFRRTQLVSDSISAISLSPVCYIIILYIFYIDALLLFACLGTPVIGTYPLESTGSTDEYVTDHTIDDDEEKVDLVDLRLEDFESKSPPTAVPPSAGSLKTAEENTLEELNASIPTVHMSERISSGDIDVEKEQFLEYIEGLA